jgi:hypothetical protein
MTTKDILELAELQEEKKQTEFRTTKLMNSMKLSELRKAADIINHLMISEI